MPELTEKEFQAYVISAARWLGWIAYHTHDSRRSAAGFPDLILVKGRYMLAIELKAGRNQPSEAQLAWLKALAGVKEVRAAVWRAEDRHKVIDELQKFANDAARGVG